MKNKDTHKLEASELKERGKLKCSIQVGHTRDGHDRSQGWALLTSDEG